MIIINMFTIHILMGFFFTFFGGVLRHTNTVKVIWQFSSLTVEGAPHVLGVFTKYKLNTLLNSVTKYYNNMSHISAL